MKFCFTSNQIQSESNRKRGKFESKIIEERHYLNKGAFNIYVNWYKGWFVSKGGVVHEMKTRIITNMLQNFKKKSSELRKRSY